MNNGMPMSTSYDPKARYNLGPRTIAFAKDIRIFVSKIPKTYLNMDDIKQLIRSSGSVAANYAEANEAESKKDFAHKCKLCRKEAKESTIWLNTLMAELSPTQEKVRKRLAQEARELTLIFAAIIRKMNQDHTTKQR